MEWYSKAKSPLTRLSDNKTTKIGCYCWSWAQASLCSLFLFRIILKLSLHGSHHDSPTQDTVLVKRLQLPSSAAGTLLLCCLSGYQPNLGGFRLWRRFVLQRPRQAATGLLPGAVDGQEHVVTATPPACE